MHICHDLANFSERHYCFANQKLFNDLAMVLFRFIMSISYINLFHAFN